MKRFILLAPILALLAFTGCKTGSNAPVAHAVFRAAVTLGEQYALESHPEAAPYLQAATPVVCAVANGTNVSSGAIVAALQKAGVTNATTIFIINGSLALYNSIASNLSTNQTELNLYGKDLCQGLIDGLPPGMGGHRVALQRHALESPHLR